MPYTMTKTMKTDVIMGRQWGVGTNIRFTMFGGGLGIVAAKAGNTGEVIGIHLLPFNDAGTGITVDDVKKVVQVLDSEEADSSQGIYFIGPLIFWQQYFDKVYEALLAQFPRHVLRPNVEQAVNLGAKRTSRGVEIAIYRS